ncbi:MULTISPECIES: hypothetical protein [unclassified Methylocaldum]|jgi:hypothetical protein|uniref:hypothetical protein n=1 Tax=unclassified Methylocaldum TaxID=2622260 RepID=UPI00098A1EB1|nr:MULTISPECIES: hypothetical protein [unclassified Methylocaldum]MBP1149744.1 hypothetical protein [Methylocaldum sp. RMAD-M]
MNRAITLNFHFAVWLSILGGIAVLGNLNLVIPEAEGFYGPMRNNLFIVVGYLLISQIVLWYFRYRRGSRIEALLMGLIFLLTAGGVELYAMLNDLPISQIFVFALVYLGASHILYYFGEHMMAEPRTERTSEPKRRGSGI